MSQPSGDGTEETKPSKNAGSESQEDGEYTSDADSQPSPGKKAKESEPQLEILILASLGSKMDDLINKLVEDKLRAIIENQAAETAGHRQGLPLRHTGGRLETPASPTGNRSNSPTDVAQLMAHLVQNDTTAVQATQKQNSRKQEKTNNSLLKSLLDAMPQSWAQNYEVLIWLFTCKQAELLPEAISEAQSSSASLRTILQQPATRCIDYKEAIKIVNNLLDE
jgi:hypothetical protein